MNNDKITSLLNRFMDGATSLEEEALLADFFRYATDSDKPQDMSDEDWLAYREMFRQFDEGFDAVSTTPEPKHKAARLIPMWRIAAAAVIVIGLSAILLMPRGQQDITPQIAEVSTEAATTDSIATDTTQIINVETIQEKNGKSIKPQRQKRLPYTMPVPRNLMAEADESNTMTREDSIAQGVREAEELIAAMTLYQDLKVSEICNVEYEEEY